jgi:DNA-binding protein HU-beta
LVKHHAKLSSIWRQFSEGAALNKQEFIDRFAAKTELSKADAARAVDAFLETVTDALRQGEEVVFIGFGTFSVQQRKAR